MSILDRWRDAFAKIDKISERLFTGPSDQSIGGRIKQLLDELERLDAGGMRQTEREVLVRIRDVLTSVAQTGGMTVTGTEFGEILNSLVKEYDPEKDAEDDAPPDAQEKPTLWVTTPEGIDGHPVDVVFYLAVDDQRVPRPAPDTWPFFSDNVDASRELERYLFLAVARAAKHRLHLSYAMAGEGATYNPSPYLAEAEKVIGRSIEKVSRVQQIAAAIAQMQPPPPQPVQRGHYQLQEIAIATLCPYRYKLERLDETARYCRDAFQMSYIAQAAWLDQTYASAMGKTVWGEEQIRQLLLKSFADDEATVKAMFPAIRPIDWQPIGAFVERSLKSTAAYYGKRGKYAAVIEAAPSDVRFPLEVSKRTVEVIPGLTHVIRVGRFRYPLMPALLYREWMLPKLNDDETDGLHLESHEGRLFFKNLFKSNQWWQRAAEDMLEWYERQRTGNMPAHSADKFKQVARDVRTLIKQIETGSYPKNIGPHCRVCPVKQVCLAADEHLGERNVPAPPQPQAED